MNRYKQVYVIGNITENNHSHSVVLGKIFIDYIKMDSESGRLKILYRGIDEECENMSELNGSCIGFSEDDSYDNEPYNQIDLYDANTEQYSGQLLMTDTLDLIYTSSKTSMTVNWTDDDGNKHTAENIGYINFK